MGEQGRADEARLRHIFIAAESSTRTAAEALLQGLPPVPAPIRGDVHILLEYCRDCPDPFLTLDIARVLRALLDDLADGAYSAGSLTEWAYAEVRLQAMASRITRLLRDQSDLLAEQALVDIAVQHLHSLEQHPRYAEILAEMRRITDSRIPPRPVALVEEFFGLARRGITLPTQPPPHP